MATYKYFNENAKTTTGHTVHTSMFPFFLNGVIVDVNGNKGIKLRGQDVNHNTQTLSTAYEIANNKFSHDKTKNPIEHASGHDSQLGKAMELVWYKDIAVSTRVA